ncbi:MULTISPECIES: nitroreductase family protein [unclassified Colwellia]|uniref:nitroreductase family protein n=1 Tax=unclassified Colwellia TaxID=196834 RepID=UPI0015F4A98D|nr:MULTISPECIES: nitroreductase family protein [unclassified Colwellia]MBA6233852.1 nitroreductase family protein [Colwellia sp. MB02u-7]MBA6237332.1 nitroreductase family protein [Colwellia sp. MB02u-11]MBA6256407.1 nitroreductase family protein [Colwellia sp. MB3u-28]MBA6260391.1 nitroreductase family protein [Colwellia sp. MB3u-41]MBA6300332.1 nitroreductase family protein [Colwellia sp. MB3u-22]
MSLTAILEKRHSVRAFLDTPVKQEHLNIIFAQAQSAPSNCNVQPWQTCVVSGAKKESLKDELTTTVMSGMPPNPDFNWLPKYEGIHRDRQFGSANALYSAIGVTREDKKGRQIAMLRNWSFFNAPHVAFFTMDKYLDIMGAVDLGIYAQTLSLIMAEHGLSNCMQGALGQFPDPIKKALNLPEQRGILFGMSFGYADKNAPVNKTCTDREDIANAVSFFK